MPACPECGTEQPTGRFCGRCGAVLAGRRNGGGEQGAELDRGSEGDRRRIAGCWMAGRWIAGALVALVVATGVALVTGDEASRSSVDPVGSTATVTADAVAPPAVSTPPRPVTDPLPCPDGTSGCVDWRTDFPEVTSLTAPTVGGDPRHVYLGGALEDGGGALYAVDPGNGIQLWRRPLPGPARQPAVSGLGAVVVAYDHPSGGTGVRTFDPNTGDVQRRFEGALHSRTAVPPVAAGSLFAVAGPGRMVIHRLDETGATIVELDATPTSLLASHSDDRPVFLQQNDGGQVLAHRADGALLWSRTSTVLGTAAVGGRTALLDSVYVVGVDVQRGEVWRTQVAAAEVPPIVTEREVIVVTRAGTFVRLSLDDGAELGRYEWPVEVAIAPSATDDAVYVPTCAGVVAADLRTGERRWFTPLGASGACASSPVITDGDGSLLVSAGAQLYGLRP